MKKVMLSIVGMLTISACYRDGGPEYNAEYFKSEVVGTWKESGYVIYDGRDKNTILDHGDLVGCQTNNGYHFANDDTYNEHQYETGTDGRCSDKGEFLGTYQYDAAAKKISMTRNDGTKSELNLIRVIYGEIRVRSTKNIDHNGDGVPDLYVAVYKRGI